MRELLVLLMIASPLLGAPETKDDSQPARVEATKSNESAFLGAAVTTLDDATRAMFQSERENGVLIQQVMPGTPAAAAGIQAGDIVTDFNGVAVRDSVDFVKQIRALKPGDVVTLKLDRGNTRDIQVEATLAGRVMPPVVAPRVHIVGPQAVDRFIIRIPASQPATAPAPVPATPDAKR